jgi:hypothetical protein
MNKKRLFLFCFKSRHQKSPSVSKSPLVLSVEKMIFQFRYLVTSGSLDRQKKKIMILPDKFEYGTSVSLEPLSRPVTSVLIY